MTRKTVLGGLLLAAAMISSPVLAQDASAQPERVIVFFGWDKPEIDGDAAALLDKIAASLLQHPGARLSLSGHADRSGSAAHNRLSGKRRAEAVRAYLAARGVPVGAMTTVSYGEERPIVPTEDGVREPQNRRVEIHFGAGSGL